MTPSSRRRAARITAAAAAFALLVTAPAAAQSRAVLEAIEREDAERSQLASLAQVLIDSIGPRLTGSSAEEAAHAWVAARYHAWEIEDRRPPT